MQVVLEEAGTRKVIFSTFDPDCATLLSLKQPRFPGHPASCLRHILPVGGNRNRVGEMVGRPCKRPAADIEPQSQLRNGVGVQSIHLHGKRGILAR